MSETRGRPQLINQPKQITVTIEQEVFERLAARAKAERLPMAEVVRRAIDNELAREEDCVELR